jgi:hypothetical protein
MVLGGSASLLGQAAFPFQISLTQGSTTSNLVNGSLINMVSTGPGQTATASIALTYLGSASAVFNTAPQILGAQAFTLIVPDSYPKTLHAGESLSFQIKFQVFAPVGSTPTTAQLNLPYVETGTPSTSGFVVLGLSGSAPDLAVSYVLPSTGNVTPVVSGGTIQFPNTIVNTTSTVTIAVTNRGNGSGSINTINIGGTAFQGLGLPSLPLNLSAGAVLQFAIRYSPKQSGADVGSLQMDLGGSVFTVTLQGIGVSSTFSYRVLLPSGPATIAPGGTITLPDTLVGSKTSIDVQVINTGTAAGTITSITFSGTGFSITDAPQLPLVLNPNDIGTVTVTFAPQQPGPATGRLHFNNDTLNLASNGIGPQLIYSYTAANSSPVTIVAGNAVVFSQQNVGKSSTVTFTVQNTGTSTGTVISIGTALPTASTDSTSVFTVANLPSLPASLSPGQSFAFNIVFSPDNTGLSTSNLLVDTSVFALTGIGRTPVPLPTYTMSGPQGTQAPFQQPAVALSLATPYSLPLKGTIVLTQDSGNLAPDPAVQFANGGQVVAFTIPANSTDAVFANGTKQIRLQTGSVASTMTLTPSFATQAGLDLTPAVPATLQFTVAKTAPQILSAAVTSFSANSFILSVTGVTTSRSLTGFQFQLTANSTVMLPSNNSTLDATGASQFWFQNSQSQAFGGQFVATIPFNIQVATGTLLSPIGGLQSISVTASNELGTSNSVTTTIP